MGHCTYTYNDSERYQLRTHESHCGAETHHRMDDVETITVDGAGNQTITKAVRPADQPDPYCPAHGGTPAPAAAQETDAAPETDATPAAKVSTTKAGS